MSATPAHLALLTLALVAVVLLALLVAVAAAVLARWDGASVPSTLARAGVAFGGTLTLLTALLAFAAGTMS
ncbi:hypothetical protein ACOT81_27100 [Streptomyces sp. WI04-05B]|uniref:hypothetical protein n=1 Tax=Streptomyces TaxID=1883 RepID=UPI0029BA7928|nr:MULTISPECIES: hypothetical protein [unclassified Streptomyces]MDX2546099.1 hypothetical protein [Streptomyces sp. WI04-05B]MDX2587211.1 hypothetical protein [Streptomyces sp. WI04-05A]MDX3752637.1 hypothetical protein [Streptomyces sp. AK08-02]